jgi:hypothetical protein
MFQEGLENTVFPGPAAKRGILTLWEKGEENEQEKEFHV